jgi:hypothetical protein
MKCGNIYIYIPSMEFKAVLVSCVQQRTKKLNLKFTTMQPVRTAQKNIAADCDSDHYLVVAKVKERLAVNKQRLHIFHTEKINLMKLNEFGGK